MAYAIIYYVVILALTAVAIYVQVTASNLSLPISKATSVLVILLPWIALGIKFYTRLTLSLNNNSSNKFSRRDRHVSSLLHRLNLQGIISALHVIQSILTVVLATNLSYTMTKDGSTTDCLLQTRWQGMWSAHDRRGIERIQDAFDCCGFNSVKDRAWPRDTCPALYGRFSACRQSWETALRTGSGLDFAVCLVVGLYQLWQFISFSYSSRQQTAARGEVEEWRPLPQDETSRPAGENSRLLEASPDVSDSGEGAETSVTSHRGPDGRLLEDNDRTNSARPHQGSQQRSSSGGGGGYGAVENGERSAALVPSGLGNEADAWR